MSEENDERKGLPSGSATGRIAACPGSYQLSKLYHAPPVDPWADSGSRIASYIEAIETGGELPEDADEEELETAKFLVDKKATLFLKICEDNGYDPEEFLVEHEKRLWYTNLEGELIYSGQLDTFFRHKILPVFIVLDDKSGWLEQPPPAMNLQLRAYSLLLVNNFFPSNASVPKELRVHVATVSRFWDVAANLDYEAIRADAMVHIGAKMQFALKSKPFQAGLVVGDWCRYCPARLQCPAMSNELVKIEGDLRTGEGLQIEKNEIKGKIAALTTPELEEVMMRLEVLTFLKNATENEAEARIQVNPDSFEHYEYVAPAPRKQGQNLAVVMLALKERYGISESDFLDCLRSDSLGISKSGKLVKMIAAGSKSLTQPAAFDDLCGFLRTIDGIKETEPSKKVKLK